MMLPMILRASGADGPLRKTSLILAGISLYTVCWPDRFINQSESSGIPSPTTGEHWKKAAKELALSNPDVIPSSVGDPGRVVLVQGQKVFKVVFRWQTTGALRQNHLQGEKALLKTCGDLGFVPHVLDFKTFQDFDVLVLEKAGDKSVPSPTTVAGTIALVLRVARLAFALARRGISHNDLRLENFRLGATGGLYLVDFDQATPLSFRLAAGAALFGAARTRNPKPKWSLTDLLRLGLRDSTPGRLYRKWKSWLRLFLPQGLQGMIRERRARRANRLPAVPRSADPRVAKIRQAWAIAQRSNASSPGWPQAYFSYEYMGFLFPGERAWITRWNSLATITAYEGKSVLELGCNLGLLSTFLLMQAGAARAIGVDADPDIIAAAKLVADAHGVRPHFHVQDFDDPGPWENRLAELRPDVVFALNVFNWVRSKERFLAFLGRFPELVYEGHDAFELEKSRLASAGFTHIRLVELTERKRPLIYCRKR